MGTTEPKHIASIWSIVKKREELEEPQKEKVCILTINKNIKNVMEGKPLTMPLAKLNRDCRFRKMYDAYCDIAEGDLEKQRQKEYRQNPEAKRRNRERQKKFRQKNKNESR